MLGRTHTRASPWLPAKYWYLGSFRRGSCRSCSSVGHLLPKKASLCGTPSSSNSKSIRLHKYLHMVHSTLFILRLYHSKKEKSKDKNKRSVTAISFVVSLCQHFCASNKSPPFLGVCVQCESVSLLPSVLSSLNQAGLCFK